MSNVYRVFEAPSAGTKDLPIAASPWHFERDARIPLGHWELIIEFAKSIDRDRAELLEKYSVGEFDKDSYLDMDESALSQVIGFMVELKSKLESPNSITVFKNRVFNEVEEEFENDEYQRMLDAVVAVYKESQRLGEPVCAYND